MVLEGESHLSYGPFIPRNINYENKPKEDVINRPSHYHRNGIDVISFAELQFSKEELKGFYRINCLKYLTRFDKKNGVEDLKKGLFYLNKLIDLEDAQKE
ncbi:hypothetical protein B5V89_17220 [Heyndrickxia sporothermodurans]|nr:hypothetical protein B5V89_17220 [Heyndrickxia sporothermodurans]